MQSLKEAEYQPIKTDNTIHFLTTFSIMLAFIFLSFNPIYYPYQI